MIRYTTLDSPIGELLLTGEGITLDRLHMLGGRRTVDIDPRWQRDDSAFAGVSHQLGEYFAGERRRFDVPLELRGSEFERRVWAALLKIPYGETRSYGEIAAQVCSPAAARAVGVANARNPVAVIVPCHRVIGTDGSLTGFGGGLERKRLLLDLESGLAQLAIQEPV